MYIWQGFGVSDIRNPQCRSKPGFFSNFLKKKGMKTPDVVQPDVLVFSDLQVNITEKGRYMGTPDLVIEILSDSTRTKDMLDKLNSYMLSTVKEYWIVDPRQESIIIYNFENNDIDHIMVYEHGSDAHSRIFAGLSVNVTELFSELIYGEADHR